MSGCNRGFFWGKMKHQKWKEKAKCRELQPKTSDALFFIDNSKQPILARIFCKDCPVKFECLEYAVTYDCLGVWGGLSESERRRLRQTGAIVPAQRVEEHLVVNFIDINRTVQQVLEDIY